MGADAPVFLGPIDVWCLTTVPSADAISIYVLQGLLSILYIKENHRAILLFQNAFPEVYS